MLVSLLLSVTLLLSTLLSLWVIVGVSIVFISLVICVLVGNELFVSAADTIDIPSSKISIVTEKSNIFLFFIHSSSVYINNMKII